MNKKQFDKQKIISHWVAGSDEDYDTMIVLYDNHQYSWSLFIGHLTIEKLLKAYFIKVKDDYPPFTHNLLKLAKTSGLDVSEELKINLTTITAFNLNTRYDDYKMSFQKKCTPAFTLDWVNKIIEIRLWIKEQIK